MPAIKLKDVRLSFPDLFVAKDYQNDGKFRYNATFLITPGSENDKIVQAAISEAAAETFAKGAAAKLESFKNNGNKMCYVNGNLKEYDGYQGMLALTGHRPMASGRPLIIDGNKNPLTEKDGKPYAGCYVNVSLDIYAQDGKNPGIRCGLKGVQFSRDGDAFSGSKVASPDDFETVDAPPEDAEASLV